MAADDIYYLRRDIYYLRRGTTRSNVLNHYGRLLFM